MSSKSSKTDGKDKGRTKREKLSPTMPFEEAFDEMFPNKTNEYYRKYIELIDYAKSEEYELQEYYEKHHIVPRSFYEKKHMSIDNSDDNLVALNLTDHFMAHWYITKCCVQKMKRSMEYAVVLMSNMVNCKTNKEDCAIAKAVAFALSKVDKMRIPMSEETRSKISESLTGKHRSEDIKNKISQSLTGNHCAPTKPVLQFSKDDGEFIAEYSSAQEASRQTGCDKSSICRCCKGKYKTAGGFIWKYKE